MSVTCRKCRIKQGALAITNDTQIVKIFKYVITNLFLRSYSVLKVAREVLYDTTEQPKDVHEDVHEPHNHHNHNENEQL